MNHLFNMIIFFITYIVYVTLCTSLSICKHYMSHLLSIKIYYLDKIQYIYVIVKINDKNL